VLWRTADEWTEHRRLTQPGESPTRLFGFDLSLADETAVVGHHYDDEYGKRAGAVTVYQ